MDKEIPGFGFAQEDPRTLFELLDAGRGGALLCVASAGEIPLSILSMGNNSVTAVDISELQLKLTRFKLAASLCLPAKDAATLIGLTPAPARDREKLFRELPASMFSIEDLAFWRSRPELIKRGPANCGRYEKYLSKFSPFARQIIGKKNLEDLLSCNTPVEQEMVFDQQIANRKALHYLFRICFHPWIYGRNGLGEDGLRYRDSSNPGDYFFKKFRDFCTSSLASKNYFLQYFLLGQCLDKAALPEYLQPINRNKLNKNRKNIRYIHGSINQVLTACLSGSFSHIHLSNIGDWIDNDDRKLLFDLLYEKTTPGTLISYHFIYRPPVKKDIEQRFNLTHSNDLDLVSGNRYPFSELLQLKHL